jgi:peptidoglycan/LPS O-acetylase OafA/YrhL
VKRTWELDGLRGIAIILVIGCHYEVFARQLGGLPKFGWVGVDLFFVLSGFLITSVLLNLRGQETPFKKFYARRFLRILPPYIAFMVLIYAVTAALNDHGLYRIRAIVGNAFFLQSFGALPGTLRQMASGGSWVLAHSSLPTAKPGMTGHVSEASDVLWSLSIEEYFYLLWAPVVLWLNRRWVSITGLAICLAAFAVRWLGFIGFESYFSIFHRLDAPVFGALVALLIASDIQRRITRAVLVVAGIIGAATLTAVLVPMGNVLNMEVRDDHIFAVFGIPALSLIAAAVVGISVTCSGAKALFLLRSPALGFVGKISYTLYLLHSFVYLVLLHFFKPTWIVSLTALACSVGLSWISWTYLEQPILDGRRSTRIEKRSPAAAGKATVPEPSFGQAG